MTPKSIQEAAERAVAQVERQLGGLNGWPATTRQRVTRIIATEFQPAAVADGANAQKCFWPNGCSDSYRCTLAGQCVAAWQNQHKEQLRKQITPPAEPSAEGDVS